MNMKNKSFNHASLFTGIGGFDLAASWMGWKNVFQCEIDPFCQKLLGFWFPESELFSDIKTSNFVKYHEKIDIISGGFPCQPFSVAGKRKGTDDNRYLWPEMLRVLREVQPQWFVAENVCGLLAQQSGVVFERIYADLEDTGYKVQPFVIPACSVGAPHRRDRIWIVANSDNKRAGKLRNTCQPQGTQCSDELLGKQYPIPNWDVFPTQSPVCSRDDGIPGVLDDIAFSKWHSESIKALGNAIVPQVAYQIFRAIESVKS
jgi:DNA (cytosine-5)-methyltransferase 1